ncbi:hypothetical protein GCM10010372_73860 [Streptomyces tauricus]|nr:hypothetical protein GCM10010372_73860 [Streptomyces tauricus]
MSTAVMREAADEDTEVPFSQGQGADCRDPAHQGAPSGARGCNDVRLRVGAANHNAPAGAHHAQSCARPVVTRAIIRATRMIPP